MPFCIVSGCPSKSNKSTYCRGVMLHAFPTDIARIKRWLLQTGQDFGDIDVFAQRVFAGTKNGVYRLCSQHFSPDCYTFKKILKVDAIPSVFPHKESLLPPASKRARVEPRRNDERDLDLSFSDQGKHLHVGHRPPTLKMKEDFCLLTERILNLTLEIIWLLTGEDCTVVKTESRGSLTPITLPPRLSLTSERDKNKKILDIIKKMIELLTGEVSIKRDLGHKHLCKNAIMEDQLPLTSPDVSSKRNPPERHTGPLYSRKSAQEYPGIPQSTQMESLITVEVKGEEEDEEIAVPVITEEGIPLEINSGDQKITETKEDCTLSSQSKIEDDTLDSGSSKDLFSPYRLSSSESTHLPGFTEAAPAAPDVDCLFVCSSCGKCFSLKLPPEEYESSTPEMPLLCADCGWTVMEEGRFPQPQKIDTHRCSECGKTFGSNSDLVRHRLIHTGEKPFECPECGKRYRQRGALTEHQMVHAGIKPFRCSECGKRFTRKLFLLTHERTHTGEKPFSCSECGKCFSQESVLIRHRHIHTGLRPYTCSDCGKSFTQSSSFKVHQKIHTGADTFPCPECGKCFKQRKCLADHLRLHTGETPYCCIECGQRFAQKHLLQSHVKLHTGGREEDLPLPE